MSIVKTNTVSIRKEHRCWGCAEKYPKGTKMRAVVCTNDGKIETVYWCPVCSEIWNRDFLPWEEVGYGDLKHGNPEYWKSVQREVMTDNCAM